ncbi:GNAT family N-acetyltransferase [Halomonas dongshanensis]|uniref:GNAT family N-acetyltransferase n=1 Tax=Halomonas dongshanensis TaxID=2890835 RepID=A0ABT2EB60_9GAMM|nr:GNAT family N-acetyltransferase [Halomonas dongshanensis]MCS2608790.1 GNAT family N-acetyltransferase [Halomonas dongshanensis]
MHYRPMTIDDYDAAVALWQQTPGVRLRDADSREGIDRYLRRNPGLSVVAEAEGRLVGTIMGGHDGHRGFVQHLAVASSHRRLDIGTRLVRRCLEALEREGIQKTHLMLLADNETGKQFWTRLGWEPRHDIALYSFILNGSPNA